MPPATAGETVEIMLSAAMGGYAVFPSEFSMPAAGLRDIQLVLEPASAISGKVVDREGNPLADWRLVADRGDFSANTLTAENGTFHLASLRPGDYKIYAQSTAQQRTWHNGGMPYTLAGGLTDTSLILVWPPTDISLAGTVTDSSGDPIAGVELRSSFSLPETGERQLLRTNTDTEGRYVLTGLPDWPDFEANIQLVHRDYMQDQRYGIALDGHEEHFVLPKRPIVRGCVVDHATGDPITRFRLDHAVGASTGEGSSDLDMMEMAGRAPLEEHEGGVFSLQARGFNTLRLVVAAPGYATQLTTLDGVAPGSTVDNVEIQLQNSTPLSGTVADERGTPISGARIYLGHAILPNGPFMVRGAEGVAQTDSSGSFTVDEYPPNLSVLSVYHENYAVNWTTPKAGHPVNIVLHEGTAIEGTVFWGDVPLASERANIGVGFEEGPNVTSAFTDELGHYRLTAVPQGSVWISVGYHDDSLRRSMVRQLNSTETTNETQDFHFDAQATAFIEGSLLLDDEPVPLALIHARATLANGDTITYGVESRGDGTFTLGPISAGEYEFGPNWILLRDGSYLAPDPELVNVGKGETVNHDLHFAGY